MCAFVRYCSRWKEILGDRKSKGALKTLLYGTGINSSSERKGQVDVEADVELLSLE